MDWTNPSHPGVPDGLEGRRAAAAAALCGGRPPAARYWGNGGWFVSPNPAALPPVSVGDRHWRRWVSLAGEGEID